jgi:flagellar biosynthetic protein FliR
MECDWSSDVCSSDLLFVIGIPIKLLLGFVMLSIVVPGFLYIFQNLFKAMIDQIYDMLRLIGGA